MADRHADFADLAFGQRMIAVVAGLRRQIEGDGEAGLPLGEVLAVERIGFRGRRMAGISAEDPGFVAHRFASITSVTGLLLRCNKGAAGALSLSRTPAKAFCALQN